MKQNKMFCGDKFSVIDMKNKLWDNFKNYSIDVFGPWTGCTLQEVISNFEKMVDICLTFYYILNTV